MGVFRGAARKHSALCVLWQRTQAEFVAISAAASPRLGFGLWRLRAEDPPAPRLVAARVGSAAEDMNRSVRQVAATRGGCQRRVALRKDTTEWHTKTLVSLVLVTGPCCVAQPGDCQKLPSHGRRGTDLLSPGGSRAGNGPSRQASSTQREFAARLQDERDRSAAELASWAAVVQAAHPRLHAGGRAQSGQR